MFYIDNIANETDARQLRQYCTPRTLMQLDQMHSGKGPTIIIVRLHRAMMEQGI